MTLPSAVGFPGEYPIQQTYVDESGLGTNTLAPPGGSTLNGGTGAVKIPHTGGLSVYGFGTTWFTSSVDEKNKDSTELTISSGAVTADRSWHTIDTESDAATDDLDTITATHFVSGDRLIISPENDARTVVVKHNTGNIHLVGGTDFTMDDIDDRIELHYNGTDWVELYRAAH